MKKTNKTDNWLLLSWRKIWLIVVISFLSILLHNAFYAIFGFEDFVFFIIVVFLMPLYFIATIVYSIIWLIKRAK